MKAAGRRGGFTIVEVIAVLTVIALLATLVVSLVSGVRDDAEVIATLDEMRQIQQAVADRFHPDLGLVPQDGDEPRSATRLLCLRDDGGAGSPQYDAMLAFLAANGKDDLIEWNKFTRKGWRGPYVHHDATYDDEGVWMPVLRDAWGGRYEMVGGQDRSKACICSYGADGERSSAEDADGYLTGAGDDIVMYVFGTRALYYPEGFDRSNWGG